MYDGALLLEKLEQIDEALAKIKRRFVSIDSPDDFLDSDEGLDVPDGIAMMLIAIGENVMTNLTINTRATDAHTTRSPTGGFLFFAPFASSRLSRSLSNLTRKAKARETRRVLPTPCLHVFCVVVHPTDHYRFFPRLAQMDSSPSILL